MADLTNGYLDTLSGMNKSRLKDFLSFIQTRDPNDIMLRFLLCKTSRATNAKAIVLNTLDEMDSILPLSTPSARYLF